MTMTGPDTHEGRIRLLYVDDTSGRPGVSYILNAERLYEKVRAEFIKISSSQPRQGACTPEQERMTRLVRVAIRAALLTVGNTVLTLVLGTPTHPRVPKGVDSLDWYLDMFLRIALSTITQNDIIMRGGRTDEPGNDCIEIVDLTTKSRSSATQNTTDSGASEHHANSVEY